MVISHKHKGTFGVFKVTGVQDARARPKVNTAYYIPCASSLGRQGIDVDTRASVVESLMSSRLLFGVTACRAIAPTAVGILHSCRIHYLGRVLKQERFDDCHNMEDKEVLRLLHLNGTDACIRLMRLRSLPRMFGPHAPRTLLALLDAATRRPSILSDLWFVDLRRLYNHLKFPGSVLDGMPDPLANPTPWLTLVQDKGWSSILAIVC